ncbi:MAG: DUF4259 domain-containing protein [Kofleriaceae bacterium]
MGVWGTGAFDNDAACDWFADLADTSDLTFVTDTLSSAQEVDDDELDVELGCAAVAACEVIARLQTHARGSSNTIVSRKDAMVELVESWVRSHPARPSPDVVQLATNVLDRVTKGSELAVLWRGDSAWLSQVKDLRRRVAGN